MSAVTDWLHEQRKWFVWILVGICVLYGMLYLFGLTSLTTAQVKKNQQKYLNKTKSFKQVTVLGHKIYQGASPDEVIVQLLLWNGYSRPTQEASKDAIEAYGRVAAKSNLLTALQEDRVLLSQIDLHFEPKVVVVREYELFSPSSVPWYLDSYPVVLNHLNIHLPLKHAAGLARIVVGTGVFLALILLSMTAYGASRLGFEVRIGIATRRRLREILKQTQAQTDNLDVGELEISFGEGERRKWNDHYSRAGMRIWVPIASVVAIYVILFFVLSTLHFFYSLGYLFAVIAGYFGQLVVPSNNPLDWI